MKDNVENNERFTAFLGRYESLLHKKVSNIEPYQVLMGASIAVAITCTALAQASKMKFSCVYSEVPADTPKAATSEKPAKTKKTKQKKNEVTATEGRVEVQPTLPSAAASKMSFDLSPADVKDLQRVDVKSYIEKYSAASVAEMDKFGIPASITMAQAIIESRSGTSVLAVRNNNHFGIKCFSKSCPKGHCSNHTDDHHKDFFRMYSTKDGSWRAHSEFLVNQARYKGLLQYGKNYKLWALKLREFGYATDPTYDTKLIGIIDKYELYKLDDL